MKIFHLPDLGEGLTEAEIREWYIGVGDMIEADQPMVSVETAKAVVDVPAPYSGRIEKLHGKVGARVQTHAPLVEFSGDGGSVVGSLETGGGVVEAPTVLKSIAANKKSIKVMPAVRNLATQLEVNLADINPSGKEGQITAADVRSAAKGASQEELHGIRRSMAEVMAKSGREVVPATIMDDADITSLDDDFTVSLIKAIIAATKAEPALNATFHAENLSRTLHSELHLGIAIDTSEGLLVPVIKNVEYLSVGELRESINQLKIGANDRSLTPESFMGATFILSNFGTIAGRNATPVIVPPMVAILGCGKIYEAVCVFEGKVAIRKLAPFSLSFDHRAVTGGEAARFLAALIHFFEGDIK